MLSKRNRDAKLVSKFRNGSAYMILVSNLEVLESIESIFKVFVAHASWCNLSFDFQVP